MGQVHSGRPQKHKEIVWFGMKISPNDKANIKMLASRRSIPASVRLLDLVEKEWSLQHEESQPSASALRQLNKDSRSTYLRQAARKAVAADVMYDLGLLPVKRVIPLTDHKEQYADYPWLVRIEPSKKNGQIKVSSADCLQCKSLSIERFQKRFGVVTSAQIDAIQNAVALCLEM